MGKTSLPCYCHLNVIKTSFLPTGTRTGWPSSMPAGTGTVIFFRWLVCPAPWQVLQGFRFHVPRPLHFRQVLRIMNGPVDTVSIPVPLQLGQRSGLVPGSLPEPLQSGHVSRMLTYISLSTPKHKR